MNTTFAVILNILVMLGLIYGLMFLKKKRVSFTVRVLLSLVLGIVFGAVLQLTYGATSEVVAQSNSWFSVVGTGTASIFDLSAEGLEFGEAEQSRSESLESTLDEYQATPIQEQIIEIIPTNPFYAMTGQGRTATLSVVVFAVFISIATIGVRKKKPESAEMFTNMITALHDVVMKLVTLVLRLTLRLTPYGTLALMTRMVSSSNFSETLRLFNFVIASYVALIIVFIVHLVILMILGVNPITYLRKAGPTLMFAFSSRSSAAAIPMNIEAQTEKLGVPSSHANLSASLGASIGQNGCAGIYPAMVAVMIAPAVGIDPMTPAFLIQLILVTTFASFGIAGVGGGATFAGLTVLSAMGLPVGLVGLLIAIEPVIDMGRTMVNVSGSMLAGVVSSKTMGKLDTEVYDSSLENVRTL